MVLILCTQPWQKKTINIKTVKFSNPPAWPRQLAHFGEFDLHAMHSQLAAKWTLRERPPQESTTNVAWSGAGLGTWLKKSSLRVPCVQQPQSFGITSERTELGRNIFSFMVPHLLPEQLQFPRFHHKMPCTLSVWCLLELWDAGIANDLGTITFSHNAFSVTHWGRVSWGIIQPSVCCQVSRPAWSTCQIRWITLQQFAVQIPFRRHGVCKEKMHRGWAFYECNLNLSLVAFDSLHPGTLPLLLSCFVWQL